MLVSKAGTGLLADFGVSRVLMSDDFANLKTSSNSVNGTLRWMASEQLTAIHMHERYSLATDIWSLGMTVYVCLTVVYFCRNSADSLQEFITGRIPYEHIKSEPPVMLAIMRYQSPHEPEEPSLETELERQLWNLCKLCWYADPMRRPTIGALQDHLRILQNPPQEGSLDSTSTHIGDPFNPVHMQSPARNSMQPNNQADLIRQATNTFRSEPLSAREMFNRNIRHWWKVNNMTVDDSMLFVGIRLFDPYDLYTEVSKLGGGAAVSTVCFDIVMKC